MAKRDVETATIAVAAFNDDVKEDFVLFSSSPLFVFKSACVSDDRGDMMMMSDDSYNKRARINPHTFCRVCSREKEFAMQYILGFHNTP